MTETVPCFIYTRSTSAYSGGDVGPRVVNLPTDTSRTGRLALPVPKHGVHARRTLVTRYGPHTLSTPVLGLRLITIMNIVRPYDKNQGKLRRVANAFVRHPYRP